MFRSFLGTDHKVIGIPNNTKFWGEAALKLESWSERTPHTVFVNIYIYIYIYTHINNYKHTYKIYTFKLYTHLSGILE